MVARVGFRDGRVFAARRPVERAAIYDDAAQARPMSADELRRRMHHDVRPVLQRPKQIRRAERIIDHHGHTVRVGDPRDRIDVRDIRIRVAQRLQVHERRFGTNRRRNLVHIVCIHERRLYAEPCERMLKQIVCAAIDGLLRHHMGARLGQRLDGQRDRRCARGNSQGGHTALKRRDALLQHRLRGVGQTAIDVSRICQTKAIRRMLGILEHVTRCLIDGSRTRIRCRIGLFLSHMQLQRVEMKRVKRIIDVAPHLLPP